MQQTSGESIPGASGVDDGGRAEHRQPTRGTVHPPMHGLGTIGDHDIGMLGKRRTDRLGIGAVKEPERFLSGQLDQCCLGQQRLDRSTGARRRS